MVSNGDKKLSRRRKASLTLQLSACCGARARHAAFMKHIEHQNQTDNLITFISQVPAAAAADQVQRKQHNSYWISHSLESDSWILLRSEPRPLILSSDMRD